MERNQYDVAASAVGELLFSAAGAQMANNPQETVAMLRMLHERIQTHIPSIQAVVESINLANASQPVFSVCGIKGCTIHEITPRIALRIYEAARSSIVPQDQWSFSSDRHAGGPGWWEIVPERWSEVRQALDAIPQLDWQHCYAQARKERDRARASAQNKDPVTPDALPRDEDGPRADGHFVYQGKVSAKPMSGLTSNLLIVLWATRHRAALWRDIRDEVWGEQIVSYDAMVQAANRAKKFLAPLGLSVECYQQGGENAVKIVPLSMPPAASPTPLPKKRPKK